MISNDPAALATQYDTTDRLVTRSSAWRDTPDGRHPKRAALAAIVAAEPDAYLEIGCGTGEFAADVREALPETHIVATDRSAGMALAAAQHPGVLTQVAEAGDLPFDDASFDAVYAGWMLYHVRDLDAALAEVRRVLRPGGVFVAVTNGDQHLADLLNAAGGEALISGFSSENGADALGRHFAGVDREDFDTQAFFTDHDSAKSYLATIDADLAEHLPFFEGERTYRGASTVFVAR